MLISTNQIRALKITPGIRPDRSLNNGRPEAEVAMPVGTPTRNGNHIPMDKTNGDGESSNSEGESSSCKPVVYGVL